MGISGYKPQEIPIMREIPGICIQTKRNITRLFLNTKKEGNPQHFTDNLLQNPYTNHLTEFARFR